MLETESPKKPAAARKKAKAAKPKPPKTAKATAARKKAKSTKPKPPKKAKAAASGKKAKAAKPKPPKKAKAAASGKKAKAAKPKPPKTAKAIAARKKAKSTKPKPPKKAKAAAAGKKAKAAKPKPAKKRKRAKKPKRAPKLDLADPTVREKLKQRNLERFAQKIPTLHEVMLAHKPLSKLVIDEDGKPDVIFEGEYFYNKTYDEYVSKQLDAFWKFPRRLVMSPLQPEVFDSTAGPYIHNIIERGTNEGMNFHVGHSSDKSYFLYIYGFGLGGHIDELVERTNCKALAIIDISPEFMYHSLEVYDWCRLFDTIDEREGLLNIFIGNNPIVLSFEIRGWLRGTNPLSVDGSTSFFHYNNSIFDAAAKRLVEDRDLILSGLGFFYDETLMIKNTHHNLYSGKEKVYVRPENPRLDVPVFIIGNGPSLDNDLEFLRENQDKAIIVSSGSSLRPLALSGIIPDFQMETENLNVLPIIDQVRRDRDISSVCLVTSTTVDLLVPPIFENVLYYFRGSLSPYPIFCDNDRRTLLHPNPTVVNASLSFAQEMGFRTFYFFGTDMGTTVGVEKHHSKHAYHFTEGAIPNTQVYNIPCPANFGGTCMTSDGMFWTRDGAERAIRSYRSGCMYYNCSDGVRIDGTIPLASQLVELPDIPEGKQPTIDKIFEHFPVYSREEFDGNWDDERMQEYFNDWLDRYVELAIDLPNYDDLSYLTNLMTILAPKWSTLDAEVFGPALLFRGTFFQCLMGFEFYVRRLAKKDVRKFEKIARDEMVKVIDYLRETAKKELGSLSKDAAKHEKKKKKKQKKQKKQKSRKSR